MSTGPYSPLMLIASSGFLNNQALTANTNLANAINAFNSTTVVGMFNGVVANAFAAGNSIANSTRLSLQTMGANTLPAVTNSVPGEQFGTFVSVLGESYTTGFSGLALSQAQTYLGNGDLGKFAQIYNTCDGYRQITNQSLTSTNNSNILNSTFINMDALSTGSISLVSNNFPTFGSDLSKLGKLVNFSLLDYQGYPWVLLYQVIKVSGLTSRLKAILNDNGVSDTVLTQLKKGPTPVSGSIDKKIYSAMKKVTGNELAQIKVLLGVTVSNGIVTMADLLNPIKILPNSYQSLLVSSPTPSTTSTTNTVNLISWSRTSNSWSKSSTLTTEDSNWGLYRSWFGENPSTNWGSTGTITQLPGTVSVAASGKNVDVVIVDAVVDPNHPEFALRPDGSGGTRVKYFNWYSLNLSGDPAAGSTYNPPITTTAPNSADDSRHATHVAGTVAGNTQGWAPNANIYNISPQYVTGGVQYAYLYKYILAWHLQKKAAGDTTPTICNNSWYSRYTIPYTSITQLVYRGVTYTGPFTILQLATYGINVNGSGNALIGLRNAAMDADIQACINAGVVMVGCAGNDDIKIAADSTDVDYNNTITATGYNSGNPIYFNRGSSPGSASNVICVGAIRAAANSPPGSDGKANYSSCGPRVDLYAPGSYITSSWLTSSPPTGGGYPNPVQDPRNASYYRAKDSGTSMAAPQVTGMLACALEAAPTLTHNAARDLIISNAKINQIPDTAGGPTDPYSLQGSPNRYLALINTLYVNSVSNAGSISIPIYNSTGTVTSSASTLIANNLNYINLKKILPADQAAGNELWSQSLRQIKNILSITLRDLALAISGLETNAGLDAINALTSPVPDSVKQTIESNLIGGSGDNGLITLYDLLGTAAGYIVPGQFRAAANTLNAMQTANSLYTLTDSANGVYTVMNNCFAGDYDDPMAPGGILIPGSLPGAGTYGNIDIAFSTGLIPAGENLIFTISTTYSANTANLNTNFVNIGNQLQTETLNQTAAQLDYTVLLANSKQSAMSIASDLHTIGTQIEPNGPAEFFTAVANVADLSGQAVIASMREGRNLELLNSVGIKSDTQLAA